MNAQTMTTTQGMEQPLTLAHDIEARTEQFSTALPAHIPVERFKRVLLTAISANPTLVKADRRTLFNSAMKAATDGLLPDGREGALVIYKTKIKDGGQEKWVDAVQWMPMIAGIRKKVRNSGEIATWAAHCVHEKDEFDYQLGMDERIHHKPFLGDRGKVIAAYSIARLKSGETSFEVMTVQEIERIRLLSKSKDGGPWKDHYTEMCRKTVSRRHSKVLPMSTDLDDLIRRDDDLYDLKGSSDSVVKHDAPPRPQLQDYTAPKQEPEPEAAEEEPAAEYGPPDAYNDGQQDRLNGIAKDSPPVNIKQFPSLLSAWEEGWEAGAAE